VGYDACNEINELQIKEKLTILLFILVFLLMLQTAENPINKTQTNMHAVIVDVTQVVWSPNPGTCGLLVINRTKTDYNAIITLLMMPF